MINGTKLNISYTMWASSALRRFPVTPQRRVRSTKGVRGGTRNCVSSPRRLFNTMCNRRSECVAYWGITEPHTQTNELGTETVVADDSTCALTPLRAYIGKHRRLYKSVQMQLNYFQTLILKVSSFSRVCSFYFKNWVFFTWLQENNVSNWFLLTSEWRRIFCF